MHYFCTCSQRKTLFKNMLFESKYRFFAKVIFRFDSNRNYSLFTQYTINMLWFVLA